MRETLKSENVPGHLMAALLIGQVIRWKPGEEGVASPSNCLPSAKEQIQEILEDVGLNRPDKKEVLDALDEYSMFTEEEKADFLKNMI